jgi:hypothetical protein
MAINTTTYVLTHTAILESHACDEALEEIIFDINNYLFHFSQSWMMYIAGAHYFRCYRSWIRVNAHLEIFLKNPKAKYSMFMFLLEHELSRFLPHTYYHRKLKSLAELIAKGPEFYLFPKF